MTAVIISAILDDWCIDHVSVSIHPKIQLSVKIYLFRSFFSVGSKRSKLRSSEYIYSESVSICM